MRVAWSLGVALLSLSLTRCAADRGRATAHEGAAPRAAHSVNHTEVDAAIQQTGDRECRPGEARTVYGYFCGRQRCEADGRWPESMPAIACEIYAAFRIGSPELVVEDHEWVDLVVDMVREHRRPLQVVGFYDAAHPEREKLARRRADAVRDLLVRSGAPPHLLTVGIGPAPVLVSTARPSPGTEMGAGIRLPVGETGK